MWKKAKGLISKQFQRRDRKDEQLDQAFDIPDEAEEHILREPRDRKAEVDLETLATQDRIEQWIRDSTRSLKSDHLREGLEAGVSEDEESQSARLSAQLTPKGALATPRDAHAYKPESDDPCTERPPGEHANAPSAGATFQPLNFFGELESEARKQLEAWKQRDVFENFSRLLPVATGALVPIPGSRHDANK